MSDLLRLPADLVHPLSADPRGHCDGSGRNTEIDRRSDQASPQVVHHSRLFLRFDPVLRRLGDPSEERFVARINHAARQTHLSGNCQEHLSPKAAAQIQWGHA